MATRISLGHVSVDEYSSVELVERLLDTAFACDDTHLVMTLNAQFYVLASKNIPFQQCLARSEFLCADGHSILLASRWLSGSVLERIPGVELMQNICRDGAPRGLRVVLLGGKPGAAQDTAAKLAKCYEGLNIVGVYCPDYGFETNTKVRDSLLDDLRQVKPHVVFVGLGAPKQEMFMDQYLRKLNIPVAIGVGGSFELLSGRLKRAPMWMHGVGLEWLFRLLQEPRRLWRRYCIGNAEFLLIVLWTLCRQRLNRLARA